MPNRTYRATVHPPFWWEKVFAHPLELTFAAMGLVFGGMLIIASMHNPYEPSPPVAAMGDTHQFLMGSFLAGGAITIVVALLGRLPDLEFEWALERIGLFFSFVGWMLYAIAVYIYAPEYGGALVLAVGSMVGLAARFAVTFVIENGVNWLVGKWGRGK